MQPRTRSCSKAAAAIREHGLGLKAATVTPEGVDDVGSPNRILREEIGGRVIVRTGRRIPGVIPHGGVHAPISVVRMAVGDAYGAKEWREGEGADEVAFRTERIERRICRGVAEFAFQLAERTGAKVFGGPKYTVSPVYEGMLKEEMDAAAERHSDVPYEPQLIDATFALLIATAGDPLVIPSLNRDGDILSDLVLPLFGSIAGAESLLVAFADDDPTQVTAVMAEAAHGTAPALQGKNVANPLAMILAGAAVLGYADESRAGLARDPRGVAGGDRGRRPHRRPRRPRRDVRVHRRGDPADEVEARGLVDALAGGGFLPDEDAEARVGPGGRERARRGRGRTASPRSERAPRAPRRGVQLERYGRVDVIASNESAMHRTRASSGMSSPRRPVGYPSPSQRSWWCRTSGRIVSGAPSERSMRAPAAGWRRIRPSSSSVSGPRLSRTDDGTTSLPTSCSSAPRRSTEIRSLSRRRPRAIACANTVTRDEWPRAYGSRASIADESAAKLPTGLDSSSLARGSLPRRVRAP